MTSQNEFLDFIGEELHLIAKLETIEQKDVDNFVVQFMNIFEHKAYENLKNKESIELIVLKAFQQGKITRVQIATFLEGLFLFRNYETSLVSIIDREENINSKFSLPLKQSIRNMLSYSNQEELTISDEELDELVKKFAYEWSFLPLPEHYAYQFHEVKEENLPVKEFYLETGILLETETTDVIHLPLGARNVLMNVLYGSNAKAILPRLGKFTINHINNGMQAKARYSCLPFSGTNETLSFHGQKAGVFYALLHDEVHRRLISTIPNDLFDALFEAIELVRKETGIQWSHFIWDTVDLEFRFNRLEKDWKLGDTEANTKSFCQMLSGKITTQDELLGLFAPNTKNISLWILLIDMFEKPEKWKKYGIESQYLTSRYAPFYQFITANQLKLVGKRTADKVVFLYLQLTKMDLKSTHGMTFHFALKREKGNKAIVIAEENKLLESLNSPVEQLSWKNDMKLSNQILTMPPRICNVSDFIKTIPNYPFLVEEIYEKTFSEKQFIQSISVGFMVSQLIAFLPEYLHQRALDKILQNEEWLSKVLYKTSLLSYFLEYFPNHRAQIFNAIINTKGYLQAVTKDFELTEVKFLIWIFKEYEEEIKAKIIDLRANMKDISDITPSSTELIQNSINQSPNPHSPRFFSNRIDLAEKFTGSISSLASFHGDNQRTFEIPK